MTRYNFQITGQSIKDQHTHYEILVFVGVEPAKIKIRGHTADEFKKKYGFSITEASRLSVGVELERNDQKIKECQDIFRPASHLSGFISSLDDIDLLEN